MDSKQQEYLDEKENRRRLAAQALLAREFGGEGSGRYPKGSGEREKHLTDEHSKEAKKQGAKIVNLASASDEDVIGSKTDKGWLESKIGDNGKVVHSWNGGQGPNE